MLPNQEPYGALYIHVPFCKQRCLYCDFATQSIDYASPELRAYTDDMILAIRRAGRNELLGGVRTVYMGGGTPTFLGQKYLTELFYTLSLTMHLTEDVECSIEANPDSLDGRMVRDLWALGVNRLSIGVQSFNDAELQALGRIHTAKQARDALAAAKERFENVSVDLMCGIPGQNLESFRRSLEEAISLGAMHISVYPLTIEEGTPFANMVAAGEMPDVDSDFQADCMELAAEVLQAAGMQRYEVASYARPGFECRHNIAYWTGVPYLGLGKGAISMAQNSEARFRFDSGGEVQEELTAVEALAEDLMLGMRMTVGIGPELIDRARQTFASFDEVCDELIERGLARWEGDRLVPTTQGWLCGNELFATLLDLAP
ncbi:MAG: radical SAM family heme chaperone HemW [Eggerthellaceae bacterium]|nr:radical SAM family heme chaperone HemW [Eggerthellaceae bacterium]